MSRYRCEVRVDRRADRLEDVRDELRSLVESIQGLRVSLATDAEVDESADAARFRDFAAIATLVHEETEVLTWVVEELVEAFGWIVDLSEIEELE